MLLTLLSGFALSQAFRTTTAILAQGLTADFGLSAQSLGAFAGLFGLSFGVAQLLMGVALTQRHPVPRVVPMLRLPPEPLSLAEVEAHLQAQPWTPCPPEQRPFLEVRVKLEKPEPRLRERILAALADQPVRLARITTHYAGQGEAMADRLARQQLDELSPEQVFALCHQRVYATPPAAELQSAFAELLNEYQESSS